MYACPMPDPDGALWEELMGFVGDPSSDEPTDEPTGVKVGRLNDDGSYDQRTRADIIQDLNELGHNATS